MRMRLNEDTEGTDKFNELIAKINSVYGFKYMPKPSNNLQGYFKISTTTNAKLNCEFNKDFTLKTATLVLPTNMVNILNEDSYSDVTASIQSSVELAEFVDNYVKGQKS